MGQVESDIINRIIQETQSELILFFVLLALVMVIFMLPLYRMIRSDRKERRKDEQSRKEAETKAESERLDRYIQREAQIIQVVTQNTEVIAGLKFTLENSGIATNNALQRITERLDISNKSDERLLVEVEVLKEIASNVKSTQDSMAGDVKRVLMITDNVSQTESPDAKHKSDDGLGN